MVGKREITNDIQNMKPGESNKLYLHHVLQTLFGAENVVTELRFMKPVRQFRFDYAIPKAMLAVEYNGHGGFVKIGGKSRHGSIIGMTNDAEKLNYAVQYGWRVLQFTSLHFQEKDRKKHKLKLPKDTIMEVIARMQVEREGRAE